jgi:hypothetical protein
MISRRGAPKTLTTQLATRLSAALRSMFVCFVFIYHTIEISKYTHIGHMANRSPIYTRDGRFPVATDNGQAQSLSQARGLRKLPCNNTVYGELILGGKLGAR